MDKINEQINYWKISASRGMAKKTISKNVIREINNYIAALKADKLPIKKVVLFGSLAKGTGRKWSDIDLCVVSPKFKNAWEALDYLWSKREINDVRYVIEPVGFSPKDFNDKFDGLINEIKKTGIEMPA